MSLPPDATDQPVREETTRYATVRRLSPLLNLSNFNSLFILSLVTWESRASSDSFHTTHLVTVTRVYANCVYIPGEFSTNGVFDAQQEIEKKGRKKERKRERS